LNIEFYVFPVKQRSQQRPKRRSYRNKKITYLLPLIVWVYLHSNFSGVVGGLRKTILSEKVPFKVIQGH